MYRKECREPDLRDEIEALVQASPEDVRSTAERVAREAGASPDMGSALAAYLTQVPVAARQRLRRPADPSGTTVPATLSLKRPEDLLPLLPERSPRFKPGDRPIPGVDRQLVELLGTGGFGEVWKARNPELKSAAPVALKFCLDEQAARSLRNEADLLDRVARHGRHPGLVALHQTYLSAAPPCLEYEFVEGGDLASYIRERHAAGGMSAAEAARLMLPIARAVAFGHEMRPDAVVHRDLKPANILVQRGADGQVAPRVADFGIGAIVAEQALRQEQGRPSSHQQSLPTAVRGAYTLLYASPQQARNGPADPRDDVYALGVIWHQMLTGDLTTGAPSGLSWTRELARRGVPRSHIDLMMACFEANPAARPADAADLARRLERLVTPWTEAVTRRLTVIAAG